ncbi:hypothetical protein LRE75_09090 [Streptomyces sp. 372A]
MVRLDAVTPAQRPVFRNVPGGLPAPGALTELRAPADDGFPLRGRLALPAGASPEQPAPLLIVPPVSAGKGDMPPCCRRALDSSGSAEWLGG